MSGAGLTVTLRMDGDEFDAVTAHLLRRLAGDPALAALAGAAGEAMTPEAFEALADALDQHGEALDPDALFCRGAAKWLRERREGR